MDKLFKLQLYQTCQRPLLDKACNGNIMCWTFLHCSPLLFTGPQYFEE